MPINIIKPKKSETTVDVQLKTITTGMLKKFFDIEKEVRSTDPQVASSSAFKLAKMTTNLTDEQIENLGIEEFTEILEAINTEIDSFAKLKKKGGFQKPLASSQQS